MLHKNTVAVLTKGFLILLLAGMLSCSDTGPPTVAPKPADGKARDFVLNDLNGRKFVLGDQRGKPVLLIFGTTWCPTCRTEIPRYKYYHETYGNRGLIVVYIDIQESRDKVSRFAEKYELPYRVLLDDQGLVAEAYQIAGVPTMVLVDRDGAIVSRQYQTIDGLLKTLFKD